MDLHATIQPYARTRRTETRSLDAMNAQPPAGWAWRGTRLEGRSERATTTELNTPNLQLLRFTSEIRLQLRLRCPSNQISIVLPIDGETEIRINGRTLRVTQSGILQPANEADLVIEPGANLLFIGFNRGQFLSALTHFWGCIPENIASRERLTTLSPNHRNRVIEKASVFDDLLDKRPGRSNQLCRLMEDELLEAVLKTARADPQPSSRPERHRLAIAAESTLRADLSAVVSIAELCTVLGTSERLLHKGFSEWFGVSPTAYVKTLRLQSIRQQLERSSTNTESITGIASSWGITHMSRFSGEYREFFGEYPSSTLRRQSA
jgi:AraC-like DNA-binding protein